MSTRLNDFEKLSKYWDIIYRTGRALDIVRTTSSPDGFPKNLGYALTGFVSWAEAEEAAQVLGGEIIGMHRRDGHGLWIRDGIMIEPYTRGAESDEVHPVAYHDGDETNFQIGVIIKDD